jgi:hypothetical protein
MGRKLCKQRKRARSAVESDGPKTEGGGREARTQGNVVPFPRDWLGPREELVPFGKRAYPESDRRPEDPEPTERPLAPPPADAFWGEGSAEIHAVMPAPETRERPHRRRPHQRRPRRRPTRRTAHRAVARTFAGTSAAPGIVRPDAWLRSRTIRLAAGLLVAAACAAVALARFGAAPSGHANQASATGGGATPAAGVIADGPASAAIVLALLRSNALHRAPPANRAGAARVGQASRTTARARVNTQPLRPRHHPPQHPGAQPAHRATRALPVSEPPAPATYSPTAGSSQPTSPATSYPTRGAPPSSVASTGSTSIDTSSRSAPTSSPAKPTGATGALGPIGSPNG